MYSVISQTEAYNTGHVYISVLILFLINRLLLKIESCKYLKSVLNYTY